MVDYIKHSFINNKVVVGILVTVFGVFVFVLYDIASSRASIQEQAIFQITSYARLVSEHAVAVFDRTNSVLSHAVDCITADDIINAKALDDAHRRIIQSKLSSLQAEAFGVVSISLTNADGYVFANTVGRAPGDSLGDRGYFLKLKSSNSDAVVISETIKGRISNQWGLQMARALRFPDGRFAGMVVANLGVAGFIDFYQSLQFPKGAVVIFRDSEYRLLTRIPVLHDKYGMKIPIPDSSVIAREDNGSFIYHRNGLFDNISRMLAYRQLPRYGISATVGVPDATYLAEWYRLVVRDIAFFLLVIYGGVVTTFGIKRLHRDRQRLRDAHSQLMETHETLKTTQNYLIQSEKAAGLGQVVARASHEINTPIGVALTSASHLAARTKEMAVKFRTNTLRKNELAEYVGDTEEGLDLLVSNLHRAAQLIGSFRQVASDQLSEEARRFDLGACISEAVSIFSPMWRKSGHHVTIISPETIELEGYPGVISQIITNLLTNSLIHGYEDGEPGHIIISLNNMVNGTVEIRYTDDGKGIPETIADKIFDLFFTTRRDAGGTGIGLHIVQNLVYAKLHGTINLAPHQGKGVCFIIKFPRTTSPPGEQPR